MSRAYQALFYAQFIIAFFTLNSMGLTRVDHRGYRPVNNTVPQQKQWSPQAPSQHNIPTTRNPYQGWSAGQAASNPTNQWNPYNNTQHAYHSGQPNSTLTNQWPQRYNNTPAYPGTYNPGLAGIAGYSPQQGAHLPNVTTNWQRPSQGHLYPQLPQSNASWIGARPQPLVPTTPSSFNNNNNRWNNTYGRWNNTFVPPQQYPAGAGGFPVQSNWPIGQNRTWNNAPTMPPAGNPNFSKIPQGYPISNLPNQTAGANWWNRPNATNNNYGWGNNGAGNNAGQPTWGDSGTNVGQNNWRNNPASPGDNSWSNAGAQNNWRGGGSPGDVIGNNNWSNPGRDNSGIQGNSGAQLAPIGSGSVAPGSVPLAPIGGNNVPNSWNAGNNNSPQLAPLAPLSYGGGDPNDPSKKGNAIANPYARMFN